MALTPEDKKDVKTHLGKALANKVSKVTHDKKPQSDSLKKWLSTDKTSAPRKTSGFGFNKNGDSKIETYKS